jgi:hypothetical protein
VSSAFSPLAFRHVLEAGLDGGYEFLPFAGYEASTAPRICLLRHDVDSDPGAAVTLAEIECELGVVSTYFVMLRSPVYNLFARENHRLVAELIALGHRLGLHYDPAFPPSGGRGHTEQIELERRFLEDAFSAPVGAVAFHQPSLVPGAAEIEVEGAVKANGLAGFHFVADPNQSERVLPVLEIFRTGAEPRVQLLVHPMWWVGEEGESTFELWDRALLANWHRSQRQLLTTERGYGPARTVALAPAELQPAASVSVARP